MKNKKCPTCHGTGYQNGITECPDCGGTEEDCPTCEGTNEPICPDCEGEG